jgi:hypothetical protein
VGSRIISTAPCRIRRSPALVDVQIHSCGVSMRAGYAERMNLTLIEAFSAVMKTGSTTAAAELMRVSQPAISRSLKRLEDTTKL